MSNRKDKSDKRPKGITVVGEKTTKNTHLRFAMEYKGYKVAYRYPCLYKNKEKIVFSDRRTGITNTPKYIKTVIIVMTKKNKKIYIDGYNNKIIKKQILKYIPGLVSFEYGTI